MIKVKKIKDLSLKHNNPVILGIFAHPDDETLRIGGLLSIAAGEGITSYVACLTKGEKGNTGENLPEDDLIKIREREFFKATKLLKVKKTFLLNYKDGDLVNNKKEILKDIKNIIKRTNPSIVITHDPSGLTGHPDHITISSVLYELKKSINFKKINLYFVVQDETERNVLKAARENKDLLKNMPKVTHTIELDSDTVKLKVKICKIYSSQKLESAKSVGLTKWFSLFNTECLHRVGGNVRYDFTYKTFKSLSFKFKPV